MKLLLKYKSDIIGEPIIAKTVLETKILMNIVRAQVGPETGEIIAEVPNKYVDLVAKTLENYGVEVFKLEKPVIRDEERCIHCGACISVCPFEVFEFNKDWTVALKIENCIQCGNCLPVCTQNALVLSKII